MEHRRFALFFAAAMIPIIAAQWSMFYADRFLPQSNIVSIQRPNTANMPQPNVANIPQPDFTNMMQSNFPAMRQLLEVNDSGPSEVVSCEFYSKNNAKAHHTEKYDLLDEKDPPAILRRGQPFKMAIGFSRPFSIDSDSVTVELTLGSKRMKVRGPPVFLPVTSKKTFTHGASNWDISLSGSQNSPKYLTLQIQIPYTAGVGIWRMKVTSKVSGDKQPKVHECNKDIYILFNPWSKGDLVYMKGHIGRQEYVLNDIGQIYTGVFMNHQPKHWNFAQFHKTVLPACIFILEKSQNLKKPYLDFASRGDPIKVVSAISAMANNADDNGVIVGKWGDKNVYEDGIAPWEWTGSEPILRRYMESGGKSVRYAQCWVFSGVSTTICRALGLPCRSVTNFSSGVDPNNTLTVDTIKYDDGYYAPNSENEWNFHVWNECWMVRPDLPEGFNGWQAFSGNPEVEDRAGIYRAGPASVEAVRRGEITLLHSSAVFFSAVNADKYFWIQDKYNPHKRALKSIDTQYIGKLIVTKRPLSNTKDDITLTYKPKEGTAEERRIYQLARRKLGIKEPLFLLSTSEQKDVCFKLRCIPKIMIGQNFKMIVEVENKSSKKRTITFTISISSVYYTGSFAKRVKSDRGTFILQPSQKKELIFEVGPDNYLDKLVTHLMLRAYALASVSETNQTWAKEDNFQFTEPPLEIEFEDETIKPKLLQPLKINFSFTNPLNVTLQDCAIIIEGIDLVEYSKTKLGNLGPRETLIHVETIRPRETGSLRIEALFSSRQMVAVLGSKQLKVERV